MAPCRVARVSRPWSGWPAKERLLVATHAASSTEPGRRGRTAIAGGSGVAGSWGRGRSRSRRRMSRCSSSPTSAATASTAASSPSDSQCTAVAPAASARAASTATRVANAAARSPARGVSSGSGPVSQASPVRVRTTTRRAGSPTTWPPSSASARSVTGGTLPGRAGGPSGIPHRKKTTGAPEAPPSGRRQAADPGVAGTRWREPGRRPSYARRRPRPANRQSKPTFVRQCLSEPQRTPMTGCGRCDQDRCMGALTRVTGEEAQVG